MFNVVIVTTIKEKEDWIKTSQNPKIMCFFMCPLIIVLGNFIFGHLVPREVLVGGNLELRP